MNNSVTSTPPESFPDANLPLDYLWRVVDTPAGLWTIRLLLVACVLVMVVGYLHYSKRKRSDDAANPENKEGGR